MSLPRIYRVSMGYLLEVCLVSVFLEEACACMKNDDCQTGKTCTDGKCTTRNSGISTTDVIIAACVGGLFVLCCLVYSICGCIKKIWSHSRPPANPDQATDACDNASIDIPADFLQCARSSSVRNSAGPPPYLYLFNEKGQKAPNSDVTEPGTKQPNRTNPAKGPETTNPENEEPENEEPEEPPPSYDEVFRNGEGEVEVEIVDETNTPL